MSAIVVGQNAILPPGPLAVEVRGTVRLGSLYGIAVLPEGAEGWLSLQDHSPSWLHERDAQRVEVEFARLPQGTERVHLGVYARRAATTMRGFLPATFDLGGYGFEVAFDEMGATFLAFAELYLRNGSWKVRARSDWSVAGVVEFARRHRCTVSDASDPTPSTSDGSPPDRSVSDDWSGSAFLVGSGIAATNAHVIDGARRITAVGDSGRFTAEPIVWDEAADVAMVRMNGCHELPTIPFRTGFDLSAGEQVFAIGFPMSGFLGAGPQITSGMVANCLGPGNDTRLLQVTAPIQPGSSGGPVLDASGRLVGVAVASLAHAQNVNFAVRAALVSYLAQSVGLDVIPAGAVSPVSPDRILRASRKSLFRLECSR